MPPPTIVVVDLLGDHSPQFPDVHRLVEQASVLRFEASVERFHYRVPFRAILRVRDPCPMLDQHRIQPTVPCVHRILVVMDDPSFQRQPHIIERRSCPHGGNRVDPGGRDTNASRSERSSAWSCERSVPDLGRKGSDAADTDVSPRSCSGGGTAHDRTVRIPV